MWCGLVRLQLTWLACFFDGPIDAVSYAGMLEAWLKPQRRDRGLMQVCGCNMMENLHILPSLLALFWMSIIWAAGLAMVHQLLPRHYPGHYIPLILPHWEALCAALSRGKWLHTNIVTMMSCTELWNRYSPLLHHKCFGACHTEHSSASGCVSDMMVHMHIHMAYHDCHHALC
jgi:hypothetical protein